MRNQVQLIAYADRLGGTLDGTAALLEGPLAGLFGGVHLLPFFDAIDGVDAGFDPVEHTEVDPRLGSWEDVRKLAERVDLMADVIVNHVSSGSPQFRDFSANGARSPYAGLFLTFDRVFPRGASEADLLAIYRPRPGLPFTAMTLADGSRRLVWTTFTSEQIDIDVHDPEGRRYLENILRVFAANGIRVIRLDAAGYAVKRAGGTCFLMEETFEFIRHFSARAEGHGLEVLVEVHSHYSQQLELARRVGWVYDFALPPLVLQAIFARSARALKRWIEIRPANAVTVLDTHDGIGIVDVGPEARERGARPGLVTESELAEIVRRIHANSRGESLQATGAAAANLDLYQVNCTFYDALGRDDLAYLLARAIQFFLPGVPQVYYVGLLAGGNDMALLARTRVGRDINRHSYTRSEIDAALARPVVADLCRLIRLRNTHPAFAGAFEMAAAPEEVLDLRWRNGEDFAHLEVDLRAMAYRLVCSDEGRTVRFSFAAVEGAGAASPEGSGHAEEAQGERRSAL